jgi:hypothetical protein
MKKTNKHPKNMTTDEAISHVFHPDVLDHLKKHIKEVEKKKEKTNKKEH